MRSVNEESVIASQFIGIGQLMDCSFAISVYKWRYLSSFRKEQRHCRVVQAAEEARGSEASKRHRCKGGLDASWCKQMEFPLCD